MTQEQLDIICKDLVKTIKLLKGNPHENGLLFELGLIKNEMKMYNVNKKRNDFIKLILSGLIFFFIGWISCSSFYLGLTPPIVKEIKSKSQNNSIRFENIKEFKSKFNEFQFNSKSFIYKGQIFKEGDILGNIKIEYIIPNAQIKVLDLKERYSFIIVIPNK